MSLSIMLQSLRPASAPKCVTIATTASATVQRRTNAYWRSENGVRTWRRPDYGLEDEKGNLCYRDFLSCCENCPENQCGDWGTAVRQRRKAYEQALKTEELHKLKRRDEHNLTKPAEAAQEQQEPLVYRRVTTIENGDGMRTLKETLHLERKASNDSEQRSSSLERH